MPATDPRHPTRLYGHDNAGISFLPCDDEDCATNACPEHGGCDGEHTYEQHHDPTDHFGAGPCLCPGWGNLPSESPALGPLVNGERFAPGYTVEAALYEQSTRGNLDRPHIPGTDYYDGRDGSIERDEEEMTDDEYIEQMDAWRETVEWQRGLLEDQR